MKSIFIISLCLLLMSCTCQKKEENKTGLVYQSSRVYHSFPEELQKLGYKGNPNPDKGKGVITF